MNKLFPLIASLIFFPAALVSGCSSPNTNSNAILLQPDRLVVPPLQTWIREPKLSKTSIPELQQVLSGSAPTKTPPSTDSKPASQPTTR